MSAYIIRRLLLIIPTLLGIMVINFIIVQSAPGGPVEQTIARIKGTAVSPTARIGGGNDTAGITGMAGIEAGEIYSKYAGARGLDPELIKEIERQYGFDKPPVERFFKMMRDYLHLDFGTSFMHDRPVLDVIVEKLPVSISLGLWTMLLVYLISIPLGIKKAVRDGTSFDLWTSIVIVIGYAIPSFLFAVLLIVVFAGGSYLDLFPLRGLVSDNWKSLSFTDQIADYFWHLALPIVSLVIGSFASLTILMKNSVLEEINKQYVTTARAKGNSENRVLYHHVFRNAILVIIAGFPQAFAHIFFTGALLIEVIFSLDGLGLLGFESALNRDYPVVFGTLFVFTFIGLILNLIGDLLYAFIDPRIDFEAREA